MKGTVYGLRPRRQSQSQLDRQRRNDLLNDYVRRPNYYTTASSDWYLIKIDSNRSRNGYQLDYISREVKRIEANENIVAAYEKVSDYI